MSLNRLDEREQGFQEFNGGKISIQDFTEKLVGLKHGPYLWSSSFDIALLGKILYQAFT